MSLLAKLKPAGPSGFGYGSSASDVVSGLNLRGKRILLTGCNSGIGYESMRVLAGAGATVVGAARSLEKARSACDSVQGETLPVACELAEPASVLECVERVRATEKKLDVILLNAGIMALPKLQLAHGYDLQFFTNHVGHFILATGLLDMLAEDGRVIVLSSEAHRMAPRVGIDFDNLDGSKGYSSWGFYGQSKLANLLFVRELARRFEGSKKVTNAVHPGIIQTNLGRHMNPVTNALYALGNPLVLKDIPQGAATQCWAAVHPSSSLINGQYMADCNVARSTTTGGDMELAARLWDETEKIVSRWR
jgi:WW domain-containing oxidoreductase